MLTTDDNKDGDGATVDKVDDDSYGTMGDNHNNDDNGDATGNSAMEYDDNDNNDG